MDDELEPLLFGQQYRHLYEKQFGEIMEEYRLKRIEVYLLYMISLCDENCTAKTLVEKSSISKAHVSSVTESLKKQGYIIFIPDEKDHRKHIIRLTDDALDIINKMAQVRFKMSDIIFQGISSREVEELKNISSRIIDNINKALCLDLNQGADKK